MPITLIQPLSAGKPTLNALIGERTFLSYNTILLSSTYYPGKGNNDGAVIVFDRNSGTGKYEQIWGLSATAGSNDYYGICAAINSNFIYVGAPGAGAGSPGEGRVYEINNTGGSRFSVNQTITPGSNRGRKGWFGSSMKLVDASNLFIGAMNASPKNPGINTGAVYHYTKSGTWGYSATLSSSQASNGDEFGFSIDGNTSEMLCGSPQWNSGQGRVYLMNPNPSDANSWANTQIITLNGTGNNGPHRGQTEDLFGFSVVKGTNYAFVGAPRYKVNIDSGGGSDYRPGAVFMYQKSGLIWTFVSILTADLSYLVNNSRLEFGLTIAYNESNNYVLIGADAVDGSQGLVFGFDVSNPFNPQQTFTIQRPVVVPDSKFGHDIKLLPSDDNGMLLVGSYGAVVSPDNGSIFPPRAGAAFLYNNVNNFIVTPSPTITPTITPSQAPAPTPILKPSNWYGLNSLDPISVYEGAGPVSANYPKTLGYGGTGRNYSICRELGYYAPENNASLYNLAILYNQWCVANNLNVNNPTAMSEFYTGRGISLGFDAKIIVQRNTPSKYCSTNNGQIWLNVGPVTSNTTPQNNKFAGSGYIGNPLRNSTYFVSIVSNNQGCHSLNFQKVISPSDSPYVGYITASGLRNSDGSTWFTCKVGSYACTIRDQTTGYSITRNIGTSTGGSCDGATYLYENLSYKTNFPRNPPT
jgi:hypothetical protein